MSRHAIRHLDRAIKIIQDMDAINVLSFGTRVRHQPTQGKRKRHKTEDLSDDVDEITADGSRQLCPGLDIPNHEQVKNEKLEVLRKDGVHDGEMLCAVLASAHLNADSTSKRHLHMRAYYELEDILQRIAQSRGYPRDITKLTNKQCIELMKDSRFLYLMINTYSEIYFQGTLALLCNFSIKFDDEYEHTSNAYCKYDQREQCADILMSFNTAVFERLHASCNRSTSSGGLPCYNLLQCIMLQFEHELVHALIAANCNSWGRVGESSEAKRDHIESMLAKWHVKWENLRKRDASPETNHSRIFLTILHNLFGHKTIHATFKVGTLRKRQVDMNMRELQKRRKIKLGSSVQVFDNPGDWNVINHYNKGEYISSQRLAYAEQYTQEQDAQLEKDGVVLESVENSIVLCPYENILSYNERSPSNAFAFFLRYEVNKRKWTDPFWKSIIEWVVQNNVDNKQVKARTWSDLQVDMMHLTVPANYLSRFSLLALYATTSKFAIGSAKAY